MNNPGLSTFIVFAHERTLLYVGGDGPSTKQPIEVYHPSKDQWQIDYEMSAGFRLEHPISGLISSNCIFENN